VSVYAAGLRWRGQLFQKRWFYRICVFTAPLGFVSTIAGWMVTETGRQPWLIYGLMRTSEGAAHLAWHQVLTTLVLFVIVYTVVFSFYLFYLFKVIRTGPDAFMQPEASEVIQQAPFKYLAPEGHDGGGH